MARKRTKRKRGPPARYGRRPTLTIRLQEPNYEVIKAGAAEHGKSLSEEIEDRLETVEDLETARRQLEDMRAATTKMHSLAARLLREAAAERSAARVQTVRMAALMLLREIEGRPTRVIVDLETLLREADGVARAFGFFDPKNPPPDPEPVRPMTAEEVQRLLDEIEEIKRWLQAAQATASASDKPGGSEAA
jgi:predicted DNA-binding protein